MSTKIFPSRVQNIQFLCHFMHGGTFEWLPLGTNIRHLNHWRTQQLFFSPGALLSVSLTAPPDRCAPLCLPLHQHLFLTSIWKNPSKRTALNLNVSFPLSFSVFSERWVLERKGSSQQQQLTSHAAFGSPGHAKCRLTKYRIMCMKANSLSLWIFVTHTKSERFSLDIFKPNKVRSRKTNLSLCFPFQPTAASCNVWEVDKFSSTQTSTKSALRFSHWSTLGLR